MGDVTESELFVDRDGTIGEIIEAVGGNEPMVVFVVVGIGGVGKSALLREISRRLSDTDARVLRADFAEFVARAGVPEEGERLLTSYRTILETLAPQVDPHRAKRFCERARGSAKNAETPAAIDVAHDDIRDAFIELVGSGGPPLVVLGDDTSALAPGTLSAWLLDLLRHLMPSARVVAVLTRSELPPDRLDYPGRRVTIRLGALDGAEAEAFLAQSGTDRRWFEMIRRWSGCYPAALVLAQKLSAKYPDQPEVLDDPEIVCTHGRDLIDATMESLSEQTKQRAIEIGAVLRYFDADLLRYVFALTDTFAPPDLDDWLAELPLLEKLGDGRYRLWPFARTLLCERMRAQRPYAADQVGSRFDEAHDLVARHYDQVVNQDAKKRTYRSWLTMEDRAAQERQLEFVHHALLLPAGNRFGRFSLARAYFDQKWWWAAYIQSDFCTRLLDSAEQEASAENRQFIDAMRRFDTAYPPEMSGQMPDRETARTAIGEILDSTGIAGRVTRFRSGPEAHLRAILEVFLAQAQTVLSVDGSAADECLSNAEILFRQNPEDRWCLPWVKVYQSSRALARHRETDALEHARAGLKLAEQQDDENRDYEVEASLHHALADVLWKREHRWNAFGELARAVFYAYLFTSIPGPPDEYTAAFFRDITSSALDRILELREPADVLRACAGFVQFWSPYWELAGQPPQTASIESLLRTSPRDVAYCVFPAGPSDDDLERESDYTRRVRALHDQLRGSLDQAVAVFGRERAIVAVTSAFHRRRHGAVSPPSLAELADAALRRGRHREAAAIALPDFPQEPAEPAELFEPSDDPIWPDHWRVLPPDWGGLRHEEHQRAEAKAVVDAAVEALPPLWRGVLLRRDVDGWTYDQVARRLGVSHSHQTLMLHHARARIRAALAAHFSKVAS